ncbi:MAG: hypothetical protein ACOC36_01100, partial [Fibrobacterota bacterium]
MKTDVPQNSMAAVDREFFFTLGPTCDSFLKTLEALSRGGVLGWRIVGHLVSSSVRLSIENVYRRLCGTVGRQSDVHLILQQICVLSQLA